MRLAFINDIDLDRVKNTKYDLAIFACGYEKRCVFVSNQLDKANIKETLILGFEDFCNNSFRSENELNFRQKWGIAPQIISSDDDMDVYNALNGVFKDRGNSPSSILIDYSSMSRTWYAGFLNWLRFNGFNNQVKVDFIYSVGTYSKELSPIAVKSILPLPGCEGSSGVSTKSVAIFGLGFEGLAPLSVLDKLQPDHIYTYMAAPALIEEYPNITRENNAELISLARENIEVPLTSVEITFAKLAEVISPYLGKGDITLIPMGPKPHVLAAIILAIRFDQITCLHINGRSKTPEDVSPSGHTIAASLTFKPCN